MKINKLENGRTPLSKSGSIKINIIDKVFDIK